MPGESPEERRAEEPQRQPSSGNFGAVVRGVVRNRVGAAYQPLPTGGLAKAGQVDPVRQANRGGEDQPTGEPWTHEQS